MKRNYTAETMTPILDKTLTDVCHVLGSERRLNDLSENSRMSLDGLRITLLTAIGDLAREIDPEHRNGDPLPVLLSSDPRLKEPAIPSEEMDRRTAKRDEGRRECAAAMIQVVEKMAAAGLVPADHLKQVNSTTIEFTPPPRKDEAK